MSRDDWWARASVDDIAHAYQTARSWRVVDADAAAAEQLILWRTNQERPVDVVDLAPEPSSPSKLDQAIAWVREHGPEWLASNRLGHDTADTTGRRQDPDEDLIRRWEQAVAAADRADRGVAYDSRERRAELADHLGTAAEPRRWRPESRPTPARRSRQLTLRGPQLAAHREPCDRGTGGSGNANEISPDSTRLRIPFYGRSVPRT